MREQGGLNQLDPMRVSVSQLLDVGLLHLLPFLVKIAIGLLNNIVDDQIVHLQLVFIKVA